MLVAVLRFSALYSLQGLGGIVSYNKLNDIVLMQTI
jgi:hypothetical protein